MKAQSTGHQQVDPVPISPSPFVGRQRELKLIWNHYHAASNGNAHVVLVSGEPGIGKTLYWLLSISVPFLQCLSYLWQ